MLAYEDDLRRNHTTPLLSKREEKTKQEDGQQDIDLILNYALKKLAKIEFGHNNHGELWVG
jgi:hypothetical protein